MIQLKFFGSTVHIRSEPKQPTVSLQLVSWCSLRQEVRCPVDKSVLSSLHNALFQRLHLKDVWLYNVSPFLYRYFQHIKQFCWVDFPTLHPLLYCLSVNLYRVSPSLLEILFELPLFSTYVENSSFVASVSYRGFSSLAAAFSFFF